MYKRTRARNVRIFRDVIQGMPLKEVIAKHKTTDGIVRVAYAEVIRLLYFRTDDRKGVTSYPTTHKAIMKDAPFWLDQLNANEDKVLVIDEDWLAGVRSYSKE